MDGDRTAAAYLIKAEASLAGAEREFAAGAYDNCANRASYACFQAAIAGLLREDIRPEGRDRPWSHVFVQSQFAGVLVNRRHRSPTEFRSVLSQLFLLRQKADDAPETVTFNQAERAPRWSRPFLARIRGRGGAT